MATKYRPAHDQLTITSTAVAYVYWLKAKRDPETLSTLEAKLEGIPGDGAMEKLARFTVAVLDKTMVSDDPEPRLRSRLVASALQMLSRNYSASGHDTHANIIAWVNHNGGMISLDRAWIAERKKTGREMLEGRPQA